MILVLYTCVETGMKMNHELCRVARVLNEGLRYWFISSRSGERWGIFCKKQSGQSYNIAKYNGYAYGNHMGRETLINMKLSEIQSRHCSFTELAKKLCFKMKSIFTKVIL